MRTLSGVVGQQVPGISMALMQIMLGVLWLDMGLQKALWVVNEGHQFGWLYGGSGRRLTTRPSALTRSSWRRSCA